MLTAPLVADLSAFSGRPAATYGVFASQALDQAALMFSIVTKLSDYPDDPDLAKLAKYAILELADRLFLEQPYAEYVAKPFQSETIMSYSYSRTTATTSKIQSGVKTGLFWWDLAIDELSLPGSSVIGHGSVDVVPDGLRRDPDTMAWTLADPTDENGDGKIPPYVRIS